MPDRDPAPDLETPRRATRFAAWVAIGFVAIVVLAFTTPVAFRGGVVSS
jgi:hypothetical protein